MKHTVTIRTAKDPSTDKAAVQIDIADGAAVMYLTRLEAVTLASRLLQLAPHAHHPVNDQEPEVTDTFLRAYADRCTGTSKKTGQRCRRYTRMFTVDTRQALCSAHSTSTN